MTVSALDIQSTIVSLGLSIRDPAPAFSKNYANYVTDTNGLLYVSGQFSRNVKTGELITGKAGGELSLEAATEAARGAAFEVMLQLLAASETLKINIQLLELVGYVNAVPSFTQHPAVIDGASALFDTFFGKVSRSRLSLGCSTLPAGATIELTALLIANEA